VRVVLSHWIDAARIRFGRIREHQLSFRKSIDRLRRRYTAMRYGAIDPSASLGTRGEQAAARLLRQKRLVIVARQESDRTGEIDLIAADPRRRVLIFVEVKTLASRKPGHPAERVDVDKQRRISRAALRYLKRKDLIGVPIRFDVVAVWWPEPSELPSRIEHYEHAFEPPDSYQLI